MLTNPSRFPGGGDITRDIVEEPKERGDQGRESGVGEGRGVELSVESLRRELAE